MQPLAWQPGTAMRRALRHGLRLRRAQLRKAVGKTRVRAVGGGGVQNHAFRLAQGGHQLAAGGVGQAEDGGVGLAGHGGAGVEVLARLLREREKRDVLPPGEALSAPAAPWFPGRRQ